MNKHFTCLPVLLFHLSCLTAQVNLQGSITINGSGNSVREHSRIKSFTNASFMALIKNISQRESEKASIEKEKTLNNYESYFKEFANDHGVTSRQLKDLVDQWANEDSVKEAVNDFMLQGARSYYLQQFAASSLYYEQAAVLREKATGETHPDADNIDATCNAYILAGNSASEGADFKRAIQLYYRADSVMQYSAFAPKKKRLQEVLAVVLYEEGSRTADSEGIALLAQAIAIEQAALETYARDNFPQDWARTQSNLGTMLQEQAGRVEDSAGVALLKQSIAAYSAALTIYTKKDFRQEWARMQNNLGVVYRKLGTRSQETALFEQSVAAFHAALDVYTKTDFPQDWALMQNNLGFTLQEQGAAMDGTGGDALSTQALAACRAALEVYTKKDFPQDWALTQYNLGNLLQLQASHLKGPEAAVLFEQSATAYRSALEVYTRLEAPEQWSGTQHNLGISLYEQGRYTEGTILLTQAVTAFRAALMVRTIECVPEQWARTQSNLATALWEAGNRTEAENVPLLEQSAAAYKAALQVYTQKDYPQEWFNNQNNLGLLYEQSKQWAAATQCFEKLRDADPLYAAKKVSELRRKAQQ
jgi:tetratricopeptide (TPR) repeat protein